METHLWYVVIEIFTESITGTGKQFISQLYHFELHHNRIFISPYNYSNLYRYCFINMTASKMTI